MSVVVPNSFNIVGNAARYISVDKDPVIPKTSKRNTRPLVFKYFCFIIKTSIQLIKKPHTIDV